MRYSTEHAELVDEINRDVLGTFTPAALAGVTVETVSAEFYRCDPDVEPERFIDLANDLERALMDLYTRRSGSLRGEHRRDLKEAIVGAPRVGAGLNVPTPDKTAPVVETTRTRRGL